jgi:hypothetical protein
LLIVSPCAAKFARLGEPAPLDRLLKNVGAMVERDPKNAEAHYTLGRLHSLAFVQDTADVRATGEGLPVFPAYQGIRVPAPDPAQVNQEALLHLRLSIQEYATACKLDPKKALYWMGEGWMLEQGAPHADRASAPWTDPPAKTPASEWRSRALEAYRKSYALDRDADLELRNLGPGADASISLEAGEGILRVLKPKDASSQAEVAEVKATVAKLKSLPRVVTPIIFSVSGAADLAGLVDEGRSVSFDLGGDSRPERWPWLKPDAGILVWDPEGAGRIKGGTQLFGSVTWSMFWPDGYAPLAALDDDHDGWLSGAELRGLAVWQDANGDAISDAGEVRPLPAVGVARISCHAGGRGEAGAYNLGGLERKDGRVSPTWDWTPTSRPRK